MTRMALGLLVVAAALVSGWGSAPAEAQWWGCKTCDYDSYGQAICVSQSFVGPEGGTYCYAGRTCEGLFDCYQWCYTTTPCTWA
jgi:hypothetical protein